MKASIRHYVFRPIWIITVVTGLHATEDCSLAQHKIISADVIQKWKDYEAFSHSLQGTARVQALRDGKPQEESIRRFKQNRECALAIYPDNNRDPSSLRCALANPRYMATIRLRKSDLGNAVLEKYTPLPGDMGTLSSFEMALSEISSHFAYSRTLWLWQAVSDPSFKVTKVVRETLNGQELIRVDHVYDSATQVKKKSSHVREHGSLWLDPSRCWCIRKSKALYESTSPGERNSDMETEIVYETVDHPSGFPILKSKTQHGKLLHLKSQKKTEWTMKTDYELEVNENVPDSEFTLSAFGLPEPGSDPVKKDVPLFVWILVAAGVCAALALGFRYLAHRRARTQPTA